MGCVKHVDTGRLSFAQKFTSFLDSFERLGISLAGAAFIGMGVTALFQADLLPGAVVGAVMGFAFWSLHPHSPRD